MTGWLKTEKSPARRLVGRVLRVLGMLVVILLAALAVAWISLRDQILDKVVSTTEARLSEAGLFLKVGAHHLTWNGGVEVDGVELFSDEGMEERVATLGELTIRIPFSDFVRGDSRMVVSAGESELGIETEAGELYLSDLDFRFDVTAGRLSMDHFESRFQGLEVTLDGDVQWNPGEGGGEEETSGKLAIPDLSPVVKAASWVEFSEGWAKLALKVSPKVASDEGHDIEAVFTGKDFRWKTLPLDKARFELGLAEGAVELSSMALEGFGGHLSGGLTIDYGNDRIVLRQVKSSMDPFRLVEALPLRESVGRAMEPFRSLGGTAVRGDGIVFSLAESSRSTGVFVIDAPQGIGMASSSGEFILSDLMATVSFKDGSLKVDGERFSVFGGTGSGQCRLPLSGPFHYQAAFDGKGISAPRMSKALGGPDNYAGTVSLGYSGRGASGPRSHFGKGRLDVSDGDFYSIPIFGGLRSFLQAKSKKFGRDVAGDLGMDFSLKDGVVRSSNMKIESSATMIEVKGETDYVGKTVDIDLQAKLKGVVGVATHVVSKVMTVHGEGALGSIHWSLAPMSVFDGSGVKAVGEGAQTAVEKTGATIKGVGEALGEGVKGTAGKIFGTEREEDDE